jgi:hypothetical protein
MVRQMFQAGADVGNILQLQSDAKNEDLPVCGSEAIAQFIFTICAGRYQHVAVNC